MSRALLCILHLLPALFLLTAWQALAQHMVSVSGAEVNLRAGPGTEYPADWRLNRGYPLRVLQNKGDWLKVIDFEKDTGWIHRSLISSTPFHIVQAKGANMRSRPSTSSRIMARLVYGEVLRTLEHNGGWVKLQRSGGLRGWVAQRLLWGW
jgi:SH3-like domain-containing protein